MVNIALIAMNVLVFVLFQGMGTNEKFTMAFSAVPAEITSGKDIVTPDQVKVVRNVDGPHRELIPGLQPTPIPVYLTLLTAMFMHGGFAHLAGNMWFLWIFGDNIEDDMGQGAASCSTLCLGLLASLAHVAVRASGSRRPMCQASALGRDFRRARGVFGFASAAARYRAHGPRDRERACVCRGWHLVSVSGCERLHGHARNAGRRCRVCRSCRRLYRRRGAGQAILDWSAARRDGGPVEERRYDW